MITFILENSSEEGKGRVDSAAFSQEFSGNAATIPSVGVTSSALAPHLSTARTSGVDAGGDGPSMLHTSHIQAPPHGEQQVDQQHGPAQLPLVPDVPQETEPELRKEYAFEGIHLLVDLGPPPNFGLSSSAPECLLVFANKKTV